MFILSAQVMFNLKYSDTVFIKYAQAPKEGLHAKMHVGLLDYTRPE